MYRIQKYRIVFMILYGLLTIGASDSFADNAPTHKLVKRIVFGDAVPSGEYPWAVRLGIRGETRYRHCSAFLVDPEWIVTAWHCTVDSSDNDSNFSPAELRYSLFDLDGNSRPFRRVAEIIRHPLARQFKDTTLYHDIALLRVVNPHHGKSPLNMNLDFISDGDINQIRASNNSAFIAAGWGNEETVQASRSIELREAQIPLLNSTEISSFLADTDYEDDGNSPQWTQEDAINQLYAGHFDVSGPEACTGDSGGALLRQQSNLVEGIGWVVSGYGDEDNCGRPGYAGIYGRLSREADFLINQLGLGIVNHPAQTNNSSWGWLSISSSVLPVEAWHADRNLLGNAYICRAGQKGGIYSQELGGCLTLDENLTIVTHITYDLVIGAVQYDFMWRSNDQTMAEETDFSSCSETNHCTPESGYMACEYYCLNQQTSEIGIIKEGICLTHNIETGIRSSSDFLKLVRSSTDNSASNCPTPSTVFSRPVTDTVSQPATTSYYSATTPPSQPVTTPSSQTVTQKATSFAPTLKASIVSIGLLFSLTLFLSNH